MGSLFNSMDRRKHKRRTNSLSKKYIPNKTYVMGCRGHPGLIVKKDYYPGDIFGGDVEVKSLVDEVIENCSIYHCAPWVISKEYAVELAEYMKTHNAVDVSLKHYSEEEVRAYVEDWISRGVIYYVLSDTDGQTIRSQNVMTEEEAEEEINRLKMDWAVKNGISNPRKVHFLEYPAPPTLMTFER